MRPRKMVEPVKHGKFSHKGKPFNVYVYDHDGHITVRANIYPSVASSMKAYKNGRHDDENAEAQIVVFYGDTELSSSVFEEAKRDIAESIEEYVES